MSTLSPYDNFLNKWSRSCGAKPAPHELKLVHSKGLARPGSQNALVLAMALRPRGVTQPEIVYLLGAPHRNKIREVVASHKAKVIPMPKRHGATVYKLAV